MWTIVTQIQFLLVAFTQQVLEEGIKSKIESTFPISFETV